MSYRLELKKAAVRALRKMTPTNQNRIAAAIDSLTKEPRPSGVKKLSGEENLYRLRVGDYRIVYSIEDARLLILVIHVGHRKDIYGKLK